MTNDPNKRPVSGRRKSDKNWNQAILIGGLAMSIPGLLFGPPAFGYWMDTIFGTSPWLTLIFLAAGLVGTAFDVYVILKRVGMLS